MPGSAARRICREPASTSPASRAGSRSSSPGSATTWTPGMCWPSQATLRIPTTTRILGGRRAASRWSSSPRQGSNALCAEAPVLRESGDGSRIVDEHQAALVVENFGAYHRSVADTVARFAGFVAKYFGDGVLIYFGYPEAHEDDR